MTKSKYQLYLCICGNVLQGKKGLKVSERPFCSEKCRKKWKEIDREFWYNIGNILGYEINEKGKATGVIYNDKK